MSNTIYLGTRKGLFTLQHDSTGWRVSHVDFLGEPVTLLAEDARDGSRYATLTTGHFGAKLWRLAAGETEWEELAVPSYPEIATQTDPMGQEPNAEKPASLSEIWALQPGAPSQPGRLWAGTIPGGLFRSVDSGQSWQLIESLWNAPERRQWFGGGKDHPGIHSICVDPRDATHLTLGVSCGGVWKTVDDGATWENVGDGLRAEYMPPELSDSKVTQDPHLVAQCTESPDTMWIQHHNGIFLSRDAGRNWTELQAEPSTFGFAVCAHPVDPDTAWVVPGVKDECRVPVDGKLVVNRTTDGGKTFESLRSGLPQQHCYDIVYRHAMDVDATGDRLCFGSTTGNVWTSENAGDHWERLEAELPLVYCVRYATN